MTGSEEIERMPENPVLFKLEVLNEALGRDLESILSSIDGFQKLEAGDSRFCDLLVYEMGARAGEAEKGFKYMASVQQSGTAGEIFLTARQPQPELLIEALRTGVKEFVSQPVKKEDVMAAVARYRTRKTGATVQEIRTKGPKGKIITVTGSKGGVGTTTVAVNLATSLIGMEGVSSVLLTDLNPLGETPVFMGILPTVASWFELAGNISRVDAMYLMSVLHKHSSGIHVLPAAPSMPEEAPEPEVVRKLFTLFRSLFDFIIVDSGRSLDEVSRSVISFSNTALLVCNLNILCVVNAKKLQDNLLKNGYPGNQIEIIANEFPKGSQITIQDIEENLNRKVLSTIPNDYRIAASAINQGKPLSSLAHDTGIAKSFRNLACRLTGNTEREKEKVRFFRLK
jgi:pilus assembly protein CpaE